METYVQVGIFLVCICSLLALFVIGYCIRMTFFSKKQREKKESIRKSIIEQSSYNREPQLFLKESELSKIRLSYYGDQEASSKVYNKINNRKLSSSSSSSSNFELDGTNAGFRNPYVRPPPPLAAVKYQRNDANSLKASKSIENIDRLTYDRKGYDQIGMMGNRSQSFQDIHYQSDYKKNIVNGREPAYASQSARRNNTVSRDRRSVAKIDGLPNANHDSHNYRRENHEHMDEYGVIQKEYSPMEKYGPGPHIRQEHNFRSADKRVDRSKPTEKYELQARSTGTDRKIGRNDNYDSPIPHHSNIISAYDAGKVHGNAPYENYVPQNYQKFNPISADRRVPRSKPNETYGPNILGSKLNEGNRNNIPHRSNTISGDKRVNRREPIERYEKYESRRERIESYEKYESRREPIESYEKYESRRKPIESYEKYESRIPQRSNTISAERRGDRNEYRRNPYISDERKFHLQSLRKDAATPHSDDTANDGSLFWFKRITTTPNYYTDQHSHA